jgi:hypothetical protein
LRRALPAWKVDYVVVTNVGVNPAFTAALMTAVTGQLPRIYAHAWVWHLPVSSSRPFDATNTSSRFAQCEKMPDFYVKPGASERLTQNANKCVLAGSAAP